MKKLNQQGNTVVIVLVTVILTALIVGGGMYVWQNSVNKKSGQENMSATNNQDTGSQVVVLDEYLLDTFPYFCVKPIGVIYSKL